MKIVSIHQPNYLPWLGYFYKIYCSDIFVILDDVDFQTGNATSLTNRTKLKGPNGAFWLTVPVKSKNNSNLILDIQIDNSQPWPVKHEKTLAGFYARTMYYSQYIDGILEILKMNHISLCDLNISFIRSICNLLNTNTEIVLSSQLGVQNVQKDEKVAAICTKLGATHYLSGSGAKKYNRAEIFQSAGLELMYSNFEHPVYPQLHGDFIPGLSILDVLFNCGPETEQFLMQQS